MAYVTLKPSETEPPGYREPGEYIASALPRDTCPIYRVCRSCRTVMMASWVKAGTP